MAKDPAFLFYPGDWLGGTHGMSLEEKGAYMELLILQFNKGQFNEIQARRALGSNFDSLWGTLKDKFQNDGTGHYNVRLRKEAEKRRTFSESRRNNRNSRKNTQSPSHDPTYDSTHDASKSTHTGQRMENENENRISNENTNGIVFENLTEKNIHSMCMDIYWKWHQDVLKVKPQIDKGDGAALFLIMDYLRSNGCGNEAIVMNFKAILQSYNSWDAFQKKLTRLKQINTFLSQIIISLKQKSSSHANQSFAEKITQRFRHKEPSQEGG